MDTSTNKIKTTYDYLDRMCELYPKMSREKLRLIITNAQRNMLRFLKRGGGILISKNPSIVINSGRRFNINKDQENWVKKMRMKLRERFKRYNRKWNGYYYFSISDAQMAKLILSRNSGRGRKSNAYIFENIVMYKLFEEAALRSKYRKPHMFRIKFIVDCGWTIFKRTYKVEDFEYIYQVHHTGLIPMTDHPIWCQNMLIDTRDLAWLNVNELTPEQIENLKQNE